MPFVHLCVSICIIVADQCFQYVDDLGSSAFTFEQILDYLTVVFESLEESGLKFSLSKCEFGPKELTFLGNTISSEDMSPNKTKVSEFSSKLKTPKLSSKSAALLDTSNTLDASFQTWVRNYFPSTLSCYLKMNLN